MSIQKSIIKRLMESKHLPDGVRHTNKDISLSETVVVGGSWYWKSNGKCWTQPTDKSKPRQEIEYEKYREICKKAKEGNVDSNDDKSKDKFSDKISDDMLATLRYLEQESSKLSIKDIKEFKPTDNDVKKLEGIFDKVYNSTDIEQSLQQHADEIVKIVKGSTSSDTKKSSYEGPTKTVIKGKTFKIDTSGDVPKIKASMYDTTDRLVKLRKFAKDNGIEIEYEESKRRKTDAGLDAEKKPNTSLSKYSEDILSLIRNSKNHNTNLEKFERASITDGSGKSYTPEEFLGLFDQGNVSDENRDALKSNFLGRLKKLTSEGEYSNNLDVSAPRGGESTDFRKYHIIFGWYDDKRSDFSKSKSKSVDNDTPVKISDFKFKNYRNPDGQNMPNRTTYKDAMEDWAKESEDEFSRVLKNYSGETPPAKQLEIGFMRMNNHSSVRDLVQNSSEDGLKAARDAIYARQRKLIDKAKEYTKWDSSKKQWVK